MDALGRCKRAAKRLDLIDGKSPARPYVARVSWRFLYQTAGYHAWYMAEPFRFQTRIRFIDTDASQRIHYTAMFRYFESAEIEFMRAAGITYTRRDYDFPRVHVDCDFMLPIEHDDVIDIEVLLAKLGRSSARFEFRTLKSGELAARGSVVIVCTDRTTHRAIPIPEDLRAKLVPALETSEKLARPGEPGVRC